MRWFRNCDGRWPFLWEEASQPPGRWHGEGEGPAQYLADTPDGAWAEFLRHEEIADPDDLPGIVRSLWAIDVDVEAEALLEPELPEETLRGGLQSYVDCQTEARRLRDEGATGIEAPSAAVVDGGARGQVVRGGLVEGADRSGIVLVLFGARPEMRGWQCVSDGSPPERIIDLVRPLAP